MTKIGEFKYDNLLAGHFPIVTESVEAGEDLVRGTVVALEDGKVFAVDSSLAETEKVNPYAVLSEDAETDDVVTVYLTGEFNSHALTFGGDDTTDTHKQSLRKIGIYLKENE